MRLPLGEMGMACVKQAEQGKKHKVGEDRYETSGIDGYVTRNDAGHIMRAMSPWPATTILFVCSAI